MKWNAIVRILLAFVATMQTARAAGAAWEPSLLGGLVAALTTAESYFQSPPVKGEAK